MNNRYIYLRNRKNFPVACIATKINYQSGQIEYGYSVYNPDDKFDKNVARDEADKKADQKKLAAAWSESFTAHKSTESVLNNLLQQEDLPLRLKVAAKNWLKKVK
jgi:hypothetical protein